MFLRSDTRRLPTGDNRWTGDTRKPPPFSPPQEPKPLKIKKEGSRNQDAAHQSSKSIKCTRPSSVDYSTNSILERKPNARVGPVQTGLELSGKIGEIADKKNTRQSQATPKAPETNKSKNIERTRPFSIDYLTDFILERKPKAKVVPVYTGLELNGKTCIHIGILSLSK